MMRKTLMSFGIVIFCLIGIYSIAKPKHPLPRLGYINNLKSESEEDRANRHAIVAERRQAPVIIVHRGASAFAPENTLEAYAAAMDLGADGFEVDIRRTADGVLIVFHDPFLQRLLKGLGLISEINYYEVLSRDMRLPYGSANHRTHVPTLVAVLELAKKRAALLHLDIKESNIDQEIAEMLDAADMWDQVVVVSINNSEHIRSRSELQELTFKRGDGYLTGRDLDPEAVQEDLLLPGEIILVDDPRVPSLVLKRPLWKPIPLPKGLRAFWDPSFAQPPADPNEVRAMQVVYDLEEHVNARRQEELTAILNNADLNERFTPFGNEDYERDRFRRMIERAWAALMIGERRYKTPRAITALEGQITGRTLYGDWRYRGLDAQMALRALAFLKSKRSVPMLIDWHDSLHPELTNIVDPSGTDPIEWFDRGIRGWIVTALGDIRVKQSYNWLWQYVHKSPEEIYPLHPGAYKQAAISFIKHHPRYNHLLYLLNSENSITRGYAIMGCVDGRIPHSRSALRETHPWALSLPQAKNKGAYR